MSAELQHVDHPVLVDKAEACKILGVTESTFDRLRRNSQFRSWGGLGLYRSAELRQYRAADRRHREKSEPGTITNLEPKETAPFRVPSKAQIDACLGNGLGGLLMPRRPVRAVEANFSRDGQGCKLAHRPAGSAWPAGEPQHDPARRHDVEQAVPEMGPGGCRVGPPNTQVGERGTRHPCAGQDASRAADLPTEDEAQARAPGCPCPSAARARLAPARPWDAARCC